MRLRRHGRHVCATGKGTVYEIVYLELVEAAGGGGPAQLEPWQRWKNIKQLAVCVKVENIINVCLF